MTPALWPAIAQLTTIQASAVSLCSLRKRGPPIGIRALMQAIVCPLRKRGAPIGIRALMQAIAAYYMQLEEFHHPEQMITGIPPAWPGQLLECC